MDGSENGIGLDPDVRSLVGSQLVPYIYEDYVQNEKVADAYMKLYELGPEKRAELGEKARQYALSEFSMEKTIDLWHETLSKLVDDWKEDAHKVQPKYRIKVLEGKEN